MPAFTMREHALTGAGDTTAIVAGDTALPVTVVIAGDITLPL